VSTLPPVRATKGLFLLAVGRPDEAARELVEAAPNEHHAPYRLRALRLEYANARPNSPGVRRGLVRLAWIWNRQYAVVLRELLGYLGSLSLEDSARATLTRRLATRVVHVVDLLGRRTSYADLDQHEARSVQLVGGAAAEALAAMANARHEYREAATWFIRATNIYRTQAHWLRCGASQAAASVAALRLPSEGTEHERRLLGALRQGLEVMEFDRGQLREVDSRSGLTMGERSALHDDVLDVLSTVCGHTRGRPRKSRGGCWNHCIGPPCRTPSDAANTGSTIRNSIVCSTTTT